MTEKLQGRHHEAPPPPRLWCRLSRVQQVARIAAITLAAGMLAACGGHDGGTVRPPPSTPVTPPPVATVATINVTGGDLVLAPGSTGTLTAQSLDASGAVIDSTFTWHSSDDSVASVEGGIVTAIKVGQASITASAGGITSTAQLVVVNPSQSADQAISAALAAGDISAEQALVYRVFALFNDARLPLAYLTTSDQENKGHDLLLYDAANHFADLSADGQAQIGPYLVPPSYLPQTPVTSRVAVKALTRNSPTYDRPGFCSGALSSDWVSVDTVHFRVWYNAKTRPAQASSATAVGGFAEASYAALTDAGFQAPLSDSGWACDGGDGRVDIYLMEGNFDKVAAVTIPIGGSADGSPTATYILISASGLSGDLKALVAHEFMHTVQHSYRNMGLRNYFWTLDATADWAVNVVYPQDIAPLHLIPGFIQSVYQPLFYPNGYCDNGAACVNSADDDKMYGAHIFFQYLTSVAGPNTVSQFFANALNSDNPLDEINFVLAGQGGLTKVWPQFALQLWNQDPLPTKTGVFKDWDGEAAWAPYISASRLVGDTLPATYLAPARFANGASSAVTLNELSAIYDQYDFSKDVHSVVFYNGFSSRLTRLDTNVIAAVDYQTNKTFDGGNVLVNLKATDEQRTGRHIWALKKINGQWMEPEDWTDTLVQPICLDAAAQRVQSLVLIYSNGNYTTSRAASFDANALDKIGDQSTTLTASKTPCWQYQGTANARLDHNDGTDVFMITTSTTATYIGEPTIQQSNISAGLATVFSGWTFTADPAKVTFTANAVGTLRSCAPAFALNESAAYGREFFAVLPSFNSWVAPQDTSLYNTYNGIGTSIQFDVPNCTGITTKKLPAVTSINFNLDFTALQHVDLSNGKLDSGPAGLPSSVWDPGDYAGDPDTVINTWCLQGLRENPESPQPPVCQ